MFRLRVIGQGKHFDNSTPSGFMEAGIEKERVERVRFTIKLGHYRNFAEHVHLAVVR